MIKYCNLITFLEFIKYYIGILFRHDKYPSFLFPDKEVLYIQPIFIIKCTFFPYILKAICH